MKVSIQTQITLEEIASQLTPTDIAEIIAYKLNKHVVLSKKTPAQKMEWLSEITSKAAIIAEIEVAQPIKESTL